MQAKYIHVTSHTRVLVAALAATLLTLAMTIPAAQATSPAEVAQATDENPSDDGSSIPARIPIGVEFEENNWHFDSGALMTEEGDSGGRSDNPQLLRDRITFQEANWDLHSGGMMDEAESSEENPVGPRVTRDEIRFQEANWDHATGTLMVERES